MLVYAIFLSFNNLFSQDFYVDEKLPVLHNLRIRQVCLHCSITTLLAFFKRYKYNNTTAFCFERKQTFPYTSFIFLKSEVGWLDGRWMLVNKTHCSRTVYHDRHSCTIVIHARNNISKIASGVILMFCQFSLSDSSELIQVDSLIQYTIFLQF